MADSKCIKVDVDVDAHRQFKALASSQGLSIKSAVLEAIALWVSAKSKN